MIEIKDGWTWDDAEAQVTARNLVADIAYYTNKVQLKQKALTDLRDSCNHMHVKDHVCEVCGEHLDE